MYAIDCIAATRTRRFESRVVCSDHTLDVPNPHPLSYAHARLDIANHDELQQYSHNTVFLNRMPIEVTSSSCIISKPQPMASDSFVKRGHFRVNLFISYRPGFSIFNSSAISLISWCLVEWQWQHAVGSGMTKVVSETSVRSGNIPAQPSG